MLKTILELVGLGCFIATLTSVIVDFCLRYRLKQYNDYGTIYDLSKKKKKLEVDLYNLAYDYGTLDIDIATKWDNAYYLQCLEGTAKYDLACAIYESILEVDHKLTKEMQKRGVIEE